jgi:hypothetical protein
MLGQSCQRFKATPLRSVVARFASQHLFSLVRCCETLCVEQLARCVCHSLAPLPPILILRGWRWLRPLASTSGLP